MDGAESCTPPLALRQVSRFDLAADDASPGRRLRIFASLVQPSCGLFAPQPEMNWWQPIERAEAPTYGELLAATTHDAEYSAPRETFAHLPFRIGSGPAITAIPEDGKANGRDPDLHPALQDLGNEINEDIREALAALDDPHAYFPGVDEGIEPVTDDHVTLVIWALQRELMRELRSADGQAGHAPLPAAPLAELPWNVQRALVERRRLRYKEWGIGRTEYQNNEWSLWNVPEDADYVPRRAARLSVRRSA